MKNSSIMFLIIAGFAGFADLHAKAKKQEVKLGSVNDALPFAPKTREQQILLFSADVPSHEPARKGEKMIVTIIPFHSDAERTTIIAQGAPIKRTIYATLEGEARKGTQFKVPRYFVPMDQQGKKFETDEFEIIVEMPYHGTEKISPVPVAKYRIYMDWDYNNTRDTETVRLTVDNTLLFNAPVDAVDVQPYETSGLQENNM